MRWAVLALFAVTYVGITARRLRWLPVGRPAVALIGASLIAALGQRAGPPFLGVDGALAAIELNTLGLLLGMMLVAAGLGEAGFFELLARWLERRVRSQAALLWLITVGCGVLSAALVNDAVCLLAAPLVVGLARGLGVGVRPYLFAVAMGSNAGSALTLAGNPQNMLVAKLSGLTYRGYLASAALPTLVALGVTAAALHWAFRSTLAAPLAPGAVAGEPVRDRPLLWIGLVSLVGTIVANMLGVSLALSALVAGSACLLAARDKAERLLQLVDWSVLLFFAGLFVLVGALQHTGLPADWVALAGPGAGVLTLSAVLLIGSQIVSNVPLILLLEPWIRTLPDPSHAWTVTAFVATLAGNFTVLGSVANIIVFERAKERVGFVEYLKIGVPVTLASLAAGLVLLR